MSIPANQESSNRLNGSGESLGLAQTLSSAQELITHYCAMTLGLKGEHRGVCKTEMFFVFATAAPLNLSRILESGRARGQSTYILAKCFPSARIISVEIEAGTPDAMFAEERLRELTNVTCLYGDSRQVLPRYLQKADVVLIDGPKGFRALKLAFNLLRTGLPSVVFIHDFSRDKPERKFLERVLDDVFFSDHPDFIERYGFLEGAIDPVNFRWTSFACIPGSVERAYRLLLFRCALARIFSVVAEKISRFRFNHHGSQGTETVCGE